AYWRARPFRAAAWPRSSAVPRDDDADDGANWAYSRANLGRPARARARIGTGQTHRKRDAPGVGACGVFETFASTSGKAPDRTVEQCRETSASQTGEGREMALAHRYSIRCTACTTRSRC